MYTGQEKLSFATFPLDYDNNEISTFYILWCGTFFNHLKLKSKRRVNNYF